MNLHQETITHQFHKLKREVPTHPKETITTKMMKKNSTIDTLNINNGKHRMIHLAPKIISPEEELKPFKVDIKKIKKSKHHISTNTLKHKEEPPLGPCTPKITLFREQIHTKSNNLKLSLNKADSRMHPQPHREAISLSITIRILL